MKALLDSCAAFRRRTVPVLHEFMPAVYLVNVILHSYLVKISTSDPLSSARESFLYRYSVSWPRESSFINIFPPFTLNHLAPRPETSYGLRSSDVIIVSN